MKNRKVEIEEEANMFAALILMPKKLIEQDIEQGYDLLGNKSIKDLCKKYQVTENMILYRLNILINYKI